MTQTQEQIEKLKTLQESLDWAIDLADNQLPELKSALLEVKDKIDNIKLPEIDTTELAKEATLNAVSSKLDNLNVEVDLSGVAKQGENPEATNSKILEEVQNKLTPIEAVLTELNNGKQEIVDALATKNVHSSTNVTLSALANNVRSIAQSPITIDGGEIYEKQLFGSLEAPNYWNLYKVLSDLLSDGRLLTYGGIVLAEYNKDNGSDIELSGAGAGGAYVVSDKGGDGAFKMYTTDTTHTWSTEFDGKCNRWVAYCFAEENRTFLINSTNAKVISIFIGRKVGKISCNANSRISDIVVPDGNYLGDIDTGTYTTGIRQQLVLRNLGKPTKIIYNNSVVYKTYISANEISLTSGGNWPSIIESASNLKSITIEANYLKGGVLYNVSPYLVVIKAETIHSGGDNVQNLLQSGKFSNVILLDVEEITGIIAGFAGGKTKIDKYIYIGYKVNDRTRSCRISGYGTGNLITPDLEIKEGWCKPLNVAGCENLTEENIINHILKHLKQDEDMCGSGVTITLGATNLAKLTSEEAVALLDSLTNTYGYTFA